MSAHWLLWMCVSVCVWVCECLWMCECMCMSVWVMSMCVCVSVCVMGVWVYKCMSLWVCVWVYECVCELWVYDWVRECECVWVYECVYELWVCKFVYECVSARLCVSACVWVCECMSVCVWVCESMSHGCLSVWVRECVIVCARLFLSFRHLVLWIYYYYHHHHHHHHHYHHYHHPSQFTAGVSSSNSTVTDHVSRIILLNIFWLYNLCKILLLSALECIDRAEIKQVFGMTPCVDSTIGIIKDVVICHIPISPSFKSVHFCSLSVTMLWRLWLLGIACLLAYLLHEAETFLRS